MILTFICVRHGWRGFASVVNVGIQDLRDDVDTGNIGSVANAVAS
jgi:hypothetical protein